MLRTSHDWLRSLAARDTGDDSVRPARVWRVWLKGAALLAVAAAATYATAAGFDGFTSTILGGFALFIALAILGPAGLGARARVFAVPYAILVGLFLAAFGGFVGLLFGRWVSDQLLVLAYAMTALTCVGGAAGAFGRGAGRAQRWLEALFVTLGGVGLAIAVLTHVTETGLVLPFRHVPDGGRTVMTDINDVVALVVTAFVLAVGAGNLAADTALVRRLLARGRLPRDREWSAAAIPVSTLSWQLGSLLLFLGSPQSERERLENPLV